MLDLLTKLLDLLGQEQVFNIVAMVVAALWAWAQRTAGIDRKNNFKLDQALSFLEAGVQKTYQVYVKSRKTAAADGKLTEDERREAREMALSYAKGYAAEQGLSLVKTLGAEMIPVLLEKTVGKLKREASGPAVARTGNGGSNGTQGAPGQ